MRMLKTSGSPSINSTKAVRTSSTCKAHQQQALSNRQKKWRLTSKTPSLESRRSDQTSSSRKLSATATMSLKTTNSLQDRTKLLELVIDQWILIKALWKRAYLPLQKAHLGLKLLNNKEVTWTHETLLLLLTLSRPWGHPLKTTFWLPGSHWSSKWIYLNRLHLFTRASGRTIMTLRPTINFKTRRRKLQYTQITEKAGSL